MDPAFEASNHDFDTKQTMFHFESKMKKKNLIFIRTNLSVDYKMLLHLKGVIIFILFLSLWNVIFFKVSSCMYTTSARILNHGGLANYRSRET